ncbi:hypothetical protein DZS_38510 [Dickeya ananatis]
MNINALPLDANTNGWSAMLPPREAKPILRQTINADWLVIGAGYAGLAFAHRIAENHPHEQVVVLDALDSDGSASARNSGFAIDLPHNIGSSTAELKKSRQLSASVAGRAGATGGANQPLWYCMRLEPQR